MHAGHIAAISAAAIPASLFRVRRRASKSAPISAVPKTTSGRQEIALRATRQYVEARGGERRNNPEPTSDRPVQARRHRGVSPARGRNRNIANEVTTIRSEFRSVPKAVGQVNT